VDEVLDGREGEGFEIDDEDGEYGDGVASSNSEPGDNRRGPKVSVTMKGFPTSLATLTTTSYVFASSRSGSAYNHILGSRISRGPSG
jgi:hypothetical protein